MMAATPFIPSTGLLHELFNATLNPTESVRRDAEEKLKSISSDAAAGLVTLLVQLVSGEGKEITLPVRQAAAVFLKNHVEKHWETYDDSRPSLIGEEEKSMMRGAIVQVVCSCQDASLRAQLKAVVHRMVRSDFPQKWPQLLDQIVPLLQLSSGACETGLYLLHEVVSWRGHEDKNIDAIVQGQVFPLVLQVAKMALVDPTGYGIVKAALKAFYTAIQFNFSAILLGDPQVFGEWFEVMRAVFAIIPSTECDESSAVWKMKKWAMHIQNKVLSRYGNPKLDTYSASEGNKEFSKRYMAGVCTAVVEMYLLQIQNDIQGTIKLPGRHFCLVCDHLEATFRDKHTWAMVGPHIEAILRGFIFPRTCTSEEDDELWEDDPCEYVRCKLDPFNDYYSASSSALNLLVDLIRQRKKAVLIPILSFINELLSDSGSHKNLRQRDGALHMIGSLATVLQKEKQIAHQIEPMLQAFVLPELANPTLPGHLRMRACWVIEQFEETTFTDSSLLQQLLQAVLQALLTTTNELPLRVAACLALGALLNNQLVQASLPPVLPAVVEAILQAANEIELDALSFVLERLVELFAAEMAPYAQQLCARLRDTLMTSLAGYNAAGTGEDNGYFDDCDRMMAAVGLLATINSLVDAMRSNPATMACLEEELVPLLHTILTGKIMDVYEEAFELIDTLVYARKLVSPAMWMIYDQLLGVIDAVGVSYLTDLSSTFDNFISYGLGQMTEERLGRLLAVIRLVMTNHQDGVEEPLEYTESDRTIVCRWIEALLLNGRGRLDSVVPVFLDLVLPHLCHQAKHNHDDDDQEDVPISTDSSFVYHFEVIINALYYNPSLTLSYLQSSGALEAILQQWSASKEKFTRVHDKRLCIMAISAVLDAVSTLSALPPQLIQHIFGILCDAVATLPTALENRKKAIEEFQRQDDSDEEDCDSNDEAGFAEQDEEDESNEQQRSPKQRQNRVNDEEDDSDFDDDDDDYYNDLGELEEEPLFETPLDHLDVPVHLKEILSKVCGGAEAQQVLSGILSTEQLNLLKSILITQ